MSRPKQWTTVVLLFLALVLVASAMRDCSTDPCTMKHGWQWLAVPGILLAYWICHLLVNEPLPDNSYKQPPSTYDVRMGKPGSYGTDSGRRAEPQWLPTDQYRPLPPDAPLPPIDKP